MKFVLQQFIIHTASRFIYDPQGVKSENARVDFLLLSIYASQSWQSYVDIFSMLNLSALEETIKELYLSINVFLIIHKWDGSMDLNFQSPNILQNELNHHYTHCTATSSPI